MRVTTGGRVSGRTSSRAMVPYKPRSGRYKKRPYGVPIRMPSWPVGKVSRSARYGPTYRLSRRQSLEVKIKEGSGSTKSFYTNGKRSMPKRIQELFKNNQEWIVNGLSSSKLSAAAYGRQAVQYSSQYVGTNFFGDINLATGSAVTSQVSNGSELYYGTSKVTTTFTNSEYTTSYVSIYEIEPRFHMTLESTFGPTTLWKQGIEDMYGGTVNPQTGVYNVPFESPMFVHFYKVNKIIKFALGSGQSHEHVSTYHHNKKLFGAIPGVYEIVHGMTNMQMIVVSGTPINDSTNKALVSTSTCALAIVRRSTRNFTYAPQNRARYQYTETLGTIRVQT